MLAACAGPPEETTEVTEVAAEDTSAGAGGGGAHGDTDGSAESPDDADTPEEAELSAGVGAAVGGVGGGGAGAAHGGPGSLSFAGVQSMSVEAAVQRYHTPVPAMRTVYGCVAAIQNGPTIKFSALVGAQVGSAGDAQFKVGYMTNDRGRAN